MNNFLLEIEEQELEIEELEISKSVLMSVEDHQDEVVSDKIKIDINEDNIDREPSAFTSSFKQENLLVNAYDEVFDNIYKLSIPDDPEFKISDYDISEYSNEELELIVKSKSYEEFSCLGYRKIDCIYIRLD